MTASNLRHRHGKAFYSKMGVEGLQDVAGEQRVVYSSVFVWMQTLQILLPNVDHFALHALEKRDYGWLSASDAKEK